MNININSWINYKELLKFYTKLLQNNRLIKLSDKTGNFKKGITKFTVSHYFPLKFSFNLIVPTIIVSPKNQIKF